LKIQNEEGAGVKFLAIDRDRWSFGKLDFTPWNGKE
jgi:hypothetical protein